MIRKKPRGYYITRMMRIRLVKKLKGTDNVNFHSTIGLEDELI